MNCVSKNWFKVQSVPESYVFPPETRPGGNETPLCKASPVIDLKMEVGQRDRDLVIKQILEASESFGFFQVINHGVSGKVMEEAQEMFKEFFSMESEEKAKATNGSGLIYTSNTGFALDGVYLWRENLKQPCHPLEKCMQFCPDKPAKYREVMTKYLDEVKKLSLRILELISEGLGLEPSFFNELSELQLMSANYYPPCPDPSLTLGIPKHTDPSLVTILLGDASGLQMLKDGHWIEVEPVANGFVVNIGNQLQVISNGKLKSPEHRVVTNQSEARTSIAAFVNPSASCVVQPAKALVDVSPPRFGALLYKDFIKSIGAFGPDTEAIVNQLAGGAMNVSENWFKVQSVPENYVFPPENRPGENNIPFCKAIPVIDLKNDRNYNMKQIVEAGESFGFFQVINHGVSEDVMVEALRMFKDFFKMEAEEKRKAIDGSGLIYTSNDYAKDGVHLWRENLKQACYPLEECMQFGLDEPKNYREIMRRYLTGVIELSSRLLGLIAEGLGLEPSFFKESSELQLMSVNHYPPCPDPRLTLGILKHTDPSLITILVQDVSGLQMIKDGHWIGVEAVPNAFLVIIGNQMQIISNGKLKSPEHRVVTNPSEARTSIAALVNPSASCVVEPAKPLVDAAASPPRYRYKDFVNSKSAFGPDTEAILKQLGRVWMRDEKVELQYIWDF